MLVLALLGGAVGALVFWLAAARARAVRFRCCRARAGRARRGCLGVLLVPGAWRRALRGRAAFLFFCFCFRCACRARALRVACPRFEFVFDSCFRAGVRVAFLFLRFDFYRCVHFSVAALLSVGDYFCSRSVLRAFRFFKKGFRFLLDRGATAFALRFVFFSFEFRKRRRVFRFENETAHLDLTGARRLLGPS